MAVGTGVLIVATWAGLIVGWLIGEPLGRLLALLWVATGAQ